MKTCRWVNVHISQADSCGCPNVQGVNVGVLCFDWAHAGKISWQYLPFSDTEFVLMGRFFDGLWWELGKTSQLTYRTTRTHRTARLWRWCAGEILDPWCVDRWRLTWLRVCCWVSSHGISSINHRFTNLSKECQLYKNPRNSKWITRRTNVLCEMKYEGPVRWGTCLVDNADVSLQARPYILRNTWRHCLLVAHTVASI